MEKRIKDGEISGEENEPLRMIMIMCVMGKCIGLMKVSRARTECMVSPDADSNIQIGLYLLWRDVDEFGGVI